MWTLNNAWSVELKHRIISDICEHMTLNKVSAKGILKLHLQAVNGLVLTALLFFKPLPLGSHTRNQARAMLYITQQEIRACQRATARWQERRRKAYALQYIHTLFLDVPLNEKILGEHMK